MKKPVRTSGAKNERKLAFLAFTDRGMFLAEKLACVFGGTAARSGAGIRLSEWTKRHFSASEGLVFVGAAAIAVRAIAPPLPPRSGGPD